MELDLILEQNLSVAIEAVFEADPFDKATQQAFEDLLKNE